MRVLPIVVLLAACTKHGDDSDDNDTDGNDTYADGCITVDGAGGYALLGDAITVAHDGSVIALCAGDYSGSIELDKSVTINGAGSDSTTWTADVNAPVIKVADGKSLTVTGVAFSSTLSGILAADATVDVSDSTFNDMGNYAIRATGSTVTLARVTVKNAQYGGIRVSGGSLDLSDSEITGCVSAGVSVDDGASATISGNTITSTIYEDETNFLDGYGFVAKGGATAVFSNNLIGGNQYGDVLMQEAATVDMTGDTLSGSVVGLWLDGGGATLNGVTIADYIKYGIVAQTALPLTMTDTNISTTPEGSAPQTVPYSSDSAFSGSFGIIAGGTNVTMTGGSISGNNGGGFYQDPGAGTEVKVTANGTLIDNNARFGMVTFSGVMDLTDVTVSNTRDDDATCYDENQSIICNIALAAWNSDLTMHGGEIRHNASFGLAPIFKSGDIDGTLLTENTGYAMFIYAAAVNMDNVTFDANGDYSLNMNQGATAHISNSTFENGTNTSTSEYTDPDTGSVQTYVSYYQGHDAFLYQSTLIVEDSHFVNGEQGIISYSGSTTQITNSDFTGYHQEPIYTYDSDLVLSRTNFTNIGDAPVYCYLSSMSLDRVNITGVTSYPYKYEFYIDGVLNASYEYTFSGTALEAQRCETSLENVNISNFESGGVRFYDSNIEMDGVSVSNYTAGYGYDAAIDLQYQSTNPDVVLDDVSVSDVTAGYGIRVQASYDFDYDGIQNDVDTDCDGDGIDNSADTDDQNDCTGGFVQASGLTLSNIGIDPDNGTISGGTGLYLYQLEKALIEGASITNTGSDAIYAYDVGGDLADVTIDGAASNGIHADTFVGDIIGVTIDDAQDNGMYLYNFEGSVTGSDGVLDGIISAPGQNGIKVEGGTATVGGIAVDNAAESGFVLVGGTSVLSGNTVLDAAEYGAECVLSPKFTGCTGNVFDGKLGETSNCGCEAGK
jgi:hypothetical protein